MPIFKSIGSYSSLMGRVFSKPEKARVYFPLIIKEMDKIGLQSVGIVSLLVFMILSLFHYDKMNIMNKDKMIKKKT
jgi:phospholipid/cholesterol/gamma-HCH transport system permease protein